MMNIENENLPIRVYYEIQGPLPGVEMVYRMNSENGNSTFLTITKGQDGAGTNSTFGRMVSRADGNFVLAADNMSLDLTNATVGRYRVVLIVAPDGLKADTLLGSFDVTARNDLTVTEILEPTNLATYPHSNPNLGIRVVATIKNNSINGTAAVTEFYTQASVYLVNYDPTTERVINRINKVLDLPSNMYH